MSGEIVLDDRETIPPYGGEGVDRLREANDCHTPAGSPAGGQFCGDAATLRPGDYVRVQTDRDSGGRKTTIRVTGNTKRFLFGISVDNEGDEIHVPGKFDERKEIIEHQVIVRLQRLVLDRTYAMLMKAGKAQVRLKKLTEFNKCHSPAGTPVGGQFCSAGSTPAVTGRWGRAPKTAFERGAQWYSFPKGAKATALKRVALSTIGDALDKAAFSGGDVGVVRYLQSLAPAVPKGHQLVLRIGGAKDSLGGSNGANVSGMAEFVRQMTNDYEYSTSFGFELDKARRAGRTPTLSFFAVRMKTDPKGYRGGFKKGSWGR